MILPLGIFNRGNATLLYLLAILVMGGASASGLTANLFLQITGAVLIGWTLWEQPSGAHQPTGLRRFGMALVVLAIIQFLPLPPAIWAHLPGRAPVAQGFDLLGIGMPWLSLSLSPWNSLAALAWCIPALAIFVTMRAEGSPATRHVMFVVAAVAVVSTMMGVMQRGAGQFYIYTVTNYGQGPGFFANSNHQGSFLLIALALWGGYYASLNASPRRRSKDWLACQAVPLSVGVVLVGGVLLSGSLACLMLLVPLAAGLVLMARPDWRVSGSILALSLILLFGAITTFLLFVPMSNDLAGTGVTPGISRHEFLFTGAWILADFAPFGTGLGTFADIYRWYEVPAKVGQTYVNHAHNDLLELLIETGLFGLTALVLFLVWFVPRIWSLWTGRGDLPVARAASLGIAVVLAHSLVDYPLRTAAMSAMVALACVLMVRPDEDMLPRTSRRRQVEGEARKLLRI